MTHQVVIDYDDALLVNLGLSPAEFAHEARRLLAGQLYEQGKLSSGQAASLCGMQRVEFLYSLPRLGFPVSNLSEEDLDLDLDFARHG